jgi:type I restriction enzyme, S subunit
MLDNWPVCSLSDVAEDITVGHVGPMVDEYIHDGVPFLRSLNVEPFKIHLEDIKHISKGFHQKIRKSALKPGDVVIVRTGKPGACAVIPEWLKDANCSDLVIIRPGPKLDPFFLMYYVNSIASHHVNSHIVGAVQQHFNVASARDIQLNLPSLPTQHAIARVLGSLDDKIELNRQMNEMLEAMARAIFQSWFVDFDPVRAKVEGRDTGLPPEVAALFPSEIAEVDGREVPKGWGIGRLDELMVLQRGFDLPQTQIEDGPYPVVCAGGIIGNHNKFMAKGPGVTTGRSGVIGKVFFIHEDFWPHNTSLWVREFKISKPHHAFFTLQTLDLNIFNSGSAVATLNRNHIHNLPVLLPTVKVIDKFESVIRPLFMTMHHNEQQSRTLAQIRDALLPKLMRGEVQVRS